MVGGLDGSLASRDGAIQENTVGHADSDRKKSDQIPGLSARLGFKYSFDSTQLPWIVAADGCSCLQIKRECLRLCNVG